MGAFRSLPRTHASRPRAGSLSRNIPLSESTTRRGPSWPRTGRPDAPAGARGPVSPADTSECRRFAWALAHVPEKWEPVFRQGHAPLQRNLEHADWALVAVAGGRHMDRHLAVTWPSSRQALRYRAGALDYLVLLELQLVEHCVAAIVAQELVVAAGLHHAAAVDHQDALGMHDGCEPMRDRNG